MPRRSLARLYKDEFSGYSPARFRQDLFAGLRFLLIDIGIGVEREPARRSAWTVNALALLVVLAYIGWIL